MSVNASSARQHPAPLMSAGAGLKAADAGQTLRAGQEAVGGRAVRGLTAVELQSRAVPTQAAHPQQAASQGSVSLASRGCKAAVFDRDLYLKQQGANEDVASFKQSVLLDALQGGKAIDDADFFSDALSFAFASAGSGLSEGGLKDLLQALPRPLPESGPQLDTMRVGLRAVVMAFVQAEAEGPDFVARMAHMAGLLQSQLGGHPELLKACLDGMDRARSSAPDPQPAASPAGTSAQKTPPSRATPDGEASSPLGSKQPPEEWQPSAALQATVPQHAGAITAISRLVSRGEPADAVQASVQRWCAATYPTGMRPPDIVSVFSGFALAPQTDGTSEQTVAGVKGLVDALGGAKMSRENANCLVDLLHSRELTPQVRKQVVGYLGQLTGKSPDGSRTALHKAIQGDPSKFGNAGLYRPGWLGDWPRGEMAGLLKHYHACAQTSYVSSRKVEQAHAESRAQSAKPTAQPALPEEIPRAWAPYDPGPLVPRPVMQPVPGSSGLRNPADVRRDLEGARDSHQYDRGPTQPGPAVLPPSLEPSPDYDN